MCDCKVSWETDPEVEGSHNRVPVTCSQYIRELENAVLLAGLTIGADSKPGRAVLKSLRKTPSGALQVSPAGEVTGIRVTTFGVSRDITYPRSYTG